MNTLRRFNNRWAATLAGLLLGGSAGASVTTAPSNQQGGLPFTPTWRAATNSLIAGLAPSAASGNFSLNTAGRIVSELTAGGSLTISQIPNNDTSTNYLTCGNGSGAGSLLIYTLPSSAHGYDLTNITVYGGWKDNGRDAQAYTVSVATTAGPTSFAALTSVNYNASVPASTASATRVAVNDLAGGVFASNVVAVKFDFTTPSSENGYTGYAAITVGGSPSAAPSGPPSAAPPTESPANANFGVSPGTSVTLAAAATGSTPISYQWQTDGGTGGALTNIPGGTAATLSVNTTDRPYGAYQYAYAASNAFGSAASPIAVVSVVAMADLGVAAPSPGPNDISQLLNSSQSDDGINYYTDNGASYGNWCGQTFTTGTNQSGYLWQTLGWKSAGNGSGFTVSQTYDLYVYSISGDGRIATVIATYKGVGAANENDWLQWKGLSVPLAPNGIYAYAFGHDGSGTGWERIGDQGGNPYPGGQIMSVGNTTGSGPVTYGATGVSDAAFDLGLTVYSRAAPAAVAPSITPGVAVYAGSAAMVTLSEAALGTGPFSYQWLWDVGAGGAMTPIAGANSATYSFGAASLAVGSYNYSVVVSNTVSYSVSAPLTLSILGPTAPVIVTDISPAPVNVGNVGQTLSFSATFTGTTPISYQWAVDTGSGFAPIPAAGNASATSNTLTISNVQLANAGVYALTARNSVGNTASSSATLVVNPLPGAAPAPVTIPPVTLSVVPKTTNGSGAGRLTWAQGALLSATNVRGPWTQIATTLEATNYPLNTTNATTFYKVAVAAEPRIVNLYNFVRDNDFRVANSEAILYDATAQQVQLLKQANLPGTWALQHDALMDTNYQALFKAQLTPADEIAAWWEITQSLVERAGLTWRGQHEWDPTADVDFSCGYSPADRLKLVDAYMADFKTIYGYYPRTVGSWYIDEVTLAYMAQQYGVVASCNCKDQIGTDTYTLWGSYWNQAYYPSRVNAYMPAQTAAGQINLPIFRMLGSDPIYQYGGFTPGITTLEPVYPGTGGSADWVAWFVNELVTQPSLAFGYTQGGQENSFGWDAMNVGLTRQVALFEALASAGEIQVQTLAQSGQWFRDHYSLTPPTSVVALDDWQNQNRKSVWFDSRFYRLNILWQSAGLFVRDLHCFDENVVATTHTNALAVGNFDYETLPIMDGGQWSANGTSAPGMWPVLLGGNGVSSAFTLAGAPSVTETSPTSLSVQQPLSGGGMFSVLCGETNVVFSAVDSAGQSLHWACDLIGGSQQAATVQSVSSNSISYLYAGTSYRLALGTNAGTAQQLGNGNLRLTPNASGKLELLLNAAP